MKPFKRHACGRTFSLQEWQALPLNACDWRGLECRICGCGSLVSARLTRTGERMTEDRTTFIGGSDIAAIAGLSPYRSALDVYLEKTGQAPAFEGNEATRWGSALEPLIAQRYAERMGREVYAPTSVAIHPAHPWYRAHFDRLVRSPRLLLEIKTAGARQAHRWGTPGTDEIPEEYLAQVHWYLPLLPEVEAAEVPVLIGGQDFRIYRVERNPTLSAELLEIGHRFWTDNVLKRVPPEVDGSESAAAWLARRFPRQSGPVIPAFGPALDWARLLRESRDAIARAQETKALAENKLKELIGLAAGMEGPGFRISWRERVGLPLVDWDAIAKEAGISPDLIQKHTHRGNPARVFRAAFVNEED